MSWVRIPPEQLFFLFGEKRVVWVSCLPLFSIYRKEFSCAYWEFKVWMTEVWMTILESGWNLSVWLVDVVSKRWVWLDILIIIITFPTPLVLALFGGSSIPTSLFILIMFFRSLIILIYCTGNLHTAALADGLCTCVKQRTGCLWRAAVPESICCSDSTAGCSTLQHREHRQ